MQSKFQISVLEFLQFRIFKAVLVDYQHNVTRVLLLQMCGSCISY
jgi:hypothetical protein